MLKNYDIPQAALDDFCQRWQITELALFGSVLREDFRPDSDVDVLVTFAPQARWTLLDFAEMQNELSILMRREVDLVMRDAIESSHNTRRRQRILDSAQVVYVA